MTLQQPSVQQNASLPWTYAEMQNQQNMKHKFFEFRWYLILAMFKIVFWDMSYNVKQQCVLDAIQ